MNFTKNKDNLPLSFDFKIKYNDNKYVGLFKFGGKYNNQVVFYVDKKKISIERVFSPPDNLKLNLEILENNKRKLVTLKKDNCCENYLLEVINKINNKDFSYYYKRIEQDHMFRNKIEKRFLKTS